MTVPSPGRIVRYVDAERGELAAIVTEHGQDGRVSLLVLYPAPHRPVGIGDISYDPDGAAGTWHWPTISTRDRRSSDRLVTVCALLSLLAVLVTSFVAFTVLDQQGELESNGSQTEGAVCSIVAYAETQAANIREANPGEPSKTATELDALAGRMRATGIRCPARPE